MHILPLIETIRVEGGKLCLEELHRARMLYSLRYLGANEGLLSNYLETHPLCLHPTLSPVLVDNSTTLGTAYALRIVYDADTISIRSYAPYTKRVIKHLRPICLPGSFSYTHKYLDRSLFEADAATLPSDTLPIYYREGGELTDTTYTNIVLELREKLYTPQRPLLVGVQRRRLLEQGRIVPASLTLADLAAASRIYLINALMPLENCIMLASSNVLPPR